MSATGLGATLNDSKATLESIAGALIIAMGVFFLATPFVPRLNKEWRPDALISRAGTGGPVIAGLAFGVAWTPCVSPTLGSILAAASTSDTVAHGGVLLAFYSAGLAVPFLITALAFNRATVAFRWIRDHYLVITVVSGLVLIAMGTMMLTGQLTQLNVEAQRGLSSLGLDFLSKI
jgi:cytochrome c-type biogenesis protein